jgi:hypothetical protein
MTLEDLKLVHVIWADEQSLVSLALRHVLVTAYGKRLTFLVDEGVPEIELFDDEMDAEYDSEPMWDDVPDYLIRVKGMKP